MKRLPITGNYPVVGSLCISIELCIHINADAGFQFNCNVVIPDGDMLDPASHQRFIEFSKEGGLQVIDSLYLFVPCDGIDGCFLAKFSESEDLIRYFIVVFFAIGFLNEILLQGHQFFVNAVYGSCL